MAKPLIRISQKTCKLDQKSADKLMYTVVEKYSGVYFCSGIQIKIIRKLNRINSDITMLVTKVIYLV